MAGGYMNSILKIDLTRMSIETMTPSASDLRAFIGGSGLGARYLHELTNPQEDAFSEGNALIFMTGPLAGTKAFSGDRFEVVTKSPLTGIYAEASCGGKFGGMLKKSGYDGVIITGKAGRPVYLII
ncbi:MAG: aldehyde ferredoxin oxidoreductase, partial [Spirochaetales bacterium]